MNTLTYTLIFAVIGYLFGSLSPSIWLVKAINKTDVRDHGSGHAGTTNTIRQVGWLPGVAVLIGDIAKGFIPVWLANTITQDPVVVAFAAIAAVAGHCWPVFANFRGGMGLATTGGAILAIIPIGFLVALAVLVAFVLAIRHRARASVFTAIALTPVFHFLGYPASFLWMIAGMSTIIFIRFLADWGRKYKGF